MALQLRKATNINGDIVQEGGSKMIASMSASISSEGQSSVNLSVADPAAYSANRTQVRADIAAFYEAVYAEEDAMLGSEPEAPVE